MIPSTGIPKRIGAIYNRRPTSQWSPKEIKAYKLLAKSGCFESLDDLELIELYYATEKRKGDRSIARRDLQTLLNNWQSEVDRAKGWREKIKKEPRGYGSWYGSKTIEREVGTATDEDFKLAGAEAKKMIADLRAKLSPVPEVRKSTVAE